MPNPNSSINTQPTETIWRKIGINPISDSTARDWPELANQFAEMESKEMPDAASRVLRVGPMNWLQKAMLPSGVIAATSPWGTIGINRDELNKSQMDLGDVLAHELTHIRQQTQGGGGNILGSLLEKFKPYLNRNAEQEAFEAEQERPARRYDIELRRLGNAPQ